MVNNSLRFQINLRILLTSIIILLLGGLIVIWQARTSVNREITSSLNLAKQLINLHIQSPATTVDLNDWLPSFVTLEQTRHLQIRLKQANGDSVTFGANKQPETEHPMPPSWFIHLVTADVSGIEQQLTTAQGQPIVLMIAADPLDEITEAWQESGVFFAALLIMASITFIAVNLVFNKAFSAIQLIVSNLQTIEQGEYEQHLPSFSSLEFNQIASAINHMTITLATTKRENSALTLHSLEIQEEERRRLSQELHDELGQSLTAIKVMAVTAKTQPANSATIHQSIIEICDHLITVVRSMMRQLHPLMLEELGLKATLEDLINHWMLRQPELSITLNCSDDIDGLDAKMTIQLFRIIQESLTNIVRHASANQARIALSISDDDYLHIEIRDNGLGCVDNSPKSGFGLLGMRERVNSLGGLLRIHSEPGLGLVISVTIPLFIK